MKYVIRRSIFDSNSSTMHTCVIMTEDQHRKWEDENLYYYNSNGWNYTYKEIPEDKRPVNGMLYTQEEVLNFLKLAGYEYTPEDDPLDEYYYEYEDPLDIFIHEVDSDFVSASRWNNFELEGDTNYYTTPGGEKIIVRCCYGWDG